MDAYTRTAFDPQTGRAGSSLHDAREAVLSPGGATIRLGGRQIVLLSGGEWR